MRSHRRIAAIVNDRLFHVKYGFLFVDDGLHQTSAQDARFERLLCHYCNEIADLRDDCVTDKGLNQLDTVIARAKAFIDTVTTMRHHLEATKSRDEESTSDSEEEEMPSESEEGEIKE